MKKTTITFVVKTIICLFCFLLANTLEVLGQRETYNLLPTMLLDYSGMSLSGSFKIPIRSCNHNSEDSFYVRFEDLTTLRYSKKYLWMSNEEFISKILVKSFNNECIEDTAQTEFWAISKKEYETYNNPDSILKAFFLEDGLCFMPKDQRTSSIMNIKQENSKKSWCYGNIGEDLVYSRDLMICLLVLFDNKYTNFFGCTDIISVSKMLSDKEVLEVMEKHKEEMEQLKKTNSAFLLKQRETAMEIEQRNSIKQKKGLISRNQLTPH